MPTRSIRLRLTAWYTLIAAGTFAVAGIGVWFALRQSIHETVDKQLRASAPEIHQRIEDAYRAGGRSEVTEELKEQDSQTGLRVRIVDDSGQSKYPFGAPEHWGIPSQGRTVTVRAARDKPFRVLALKSSAGVIQVGLPLEEFYELLDHFTWTAILASPLLLAVACLGGYWMSARALAPIEESFRRMTQFTADASHELRTPVSIMQTTAEVALAHPRSAEEHVRSWKTVVEQTERTALLVADLLLLARADAGAERLDFEDLDAAEVLRGVCSSMSVLAEAAGLEFKTDIAPSCDCRGDEQALHRLFSILIDNAIKYTPAGGSTTVVLRDRTVSVSDTGTGIPPEDLPHIFDRFYRAAKDRSRRTGGVGLGLSIAQWIATRHGGSIQVESRNGTGSTFRMNLPPSATLQNQERK